MSSRDQIGRLIGYVLIGWGTLFIISSALNFKKIIEYAGQIVFLHQGAPLSSPSIWDGPSTLTLLIEASIAFFTGIAVLRRPKRVYKAVCLVTAVALVTALIRTRFFILAFWRQMGPPGLQGIRIVVADFARTAVGIMAIIALRRSKMWERAETGLGPACSQCGYLLCGLSEPRCPECGRVYTLDESYRLQSESG